MARSTSSKTNRRNKPAGTAKPAAKPRANGTRRKPARPQAAAETAAEPKAPPVELPSAEQIRELEQLAAAGEPHPEGLPWSESRLADVDVAARTLHAAAAPDADLAPARAPVFAAQARGGADEDLFAAFDPAPGNAFAGPETDEPPGFSDAPQDAPPPRDEDVSDPRDWPLPPGPAAVDISVIQAVAPVAARVDELLPRMQAIASDVDRCRAEQVGIASTVDRLHLQLDHVRASTQRRSDAIDDAQAMLRGGELRWVLGGIAVLLVCWSLATYFKTGDAKLAFWLLLGANALGCGAIACGRAR